MAVVEVRPRYCESGESFHDELKMRRAITDRASEELHQARAEVGTIVASENFRDHMKYCTRCREAYASEKKH